MNGPSFRPAPGPRLPRGWMLRGLVAVAGLATLSGCVTFRRPPRRTSIETYQTVLNASMVSNFLVIETQIDKKGPYHFIVDTGSSVTIVTPELLKRFGGVLHANQAPVRVVDAGGKVQLLSPATLKRLDLGSAQFEGVGVLVYDLADLSNHLGVRIDGVLGFPLFRDTVLTLDYLQSRVVITPQGLPIPLPGVTIPFNNEQNTPLIPIQIGNESFIALIDSGSDATLSLNTVGLHPYFQHGPKPGALVATLGGDRLLMTGRLGQTLIIGAYGIEYPIVDLTDELSSIGGGILRYFSVTFDQRRHQATFYRPTYEAIRIAPLRSTGLSFTKLPAYWRVAGVVTASPAEQLGVQAGDLCSRINGEPVGAWPYQRYADLVRTAKRITYTFINGSQEQEVTLPVFDLVP
ncbi:MAG TPA: aspartyl protease family protein [Opitutaceae bacterium]|nr:aspartyl protease family protein [Opitutaceae bacterium]